MRVVEHVCGRAGVCVRACACSSVRARGVGRCVGMGGKFRKFPPRSLRSFVSFRRGCVRCGCADAAGHLEHGLHVDGLDVRRQRADPRLQERADDLCIIRTYSRCSI